MYEALWIPNEMTSLVTRYIQKSYTILGEISVLKESCIIHI